MSTVILYDIPRSVPAGQNPSEIAWSPNAWKTRLALAIKGVPFKTEWVDWSDVPTKIQSLGLGPNAGPIKYSVPTIYDPKTKRAVTDSWEIAKYLDEQYPCGVALVPAHTRALQLAFEQALAGVSRAVVGLIIEQEFGQVPEKDKVYFREAWEPRLGKTLEDLTLSGDARIPALKTFEQELDKIARWLAENGGGSFVMGEKPSHADTLLAGLLQWVIRLGGNDHDAVKVIKSASGGRLGKYVEAYSQWIVDN